MSAGEMSHPSMSWRPDLQRLRCRMEDELRRRAMPWPEVEAAVFVARGLLASADTASPRSLEEIWNALPRFDAELGVLERRAREGDFAVQHHVALARIDDEVWQARTIVEHELAEPPDPQGREFRAHLEHSLRRAESLLDRCRWWTEAPPCHGAAVPTDDAPPEETHP